VGALADDNEVESVARKSWETAHKGTWEQFKDAVYHGWGKVTGAR
jgi:uncharacterized protein YjbJ (UPF0337 family)